jgi:methionyl-tRNA formyltransferase
MGARAMKLVFMGTPEFSVTVLKALIVAGHDIVCAYAQPPRPAGRGMALRLTPVHAFAESLGIEVRTPVSLRLVEEQTLFKALNADAAVVVAYGLLLPQAILDAPTHGCFNVHASLLPRWRGAAPIQRAIMAGDTETGVTIMQMDAGLDTGPTMLKVACPVDDATTAASLHDALAMIGAKAMCDVLAAPLHGGEAQPGEGATYAKKIDKAEARIDFTQPAQQVLRQIHGLSPFPGAWMLVNGTRIKVLRCERADVRGNAGSFIDDELTIACGDGAIRCLELQREGKGAMTADVFLRGFAIAAGTKVN